MPASWQTGVIHVFLLVQVFPQNQGIDTNLIERKWTDSRKFSDRPHSMAPNWSGHCWDLGPSSPVTTVWWSDYLIVWMNERSIEYNSIQSCAVIQKWFQDLSIPPSWGQPFDTDGCRYCLPCLCYGAIQINSAFKIQGCLYRQKSSKTLVKQRLGTKPNTFIFNLSSLQVPFFFLGAPWLRKRRTVHSKE